MHILDMSTRTYNAHGNDGFEYVSVGWLGDRVTHRADTDPAVVAKLRRFWRLNQLPDDWEGLHECEICPPGPAPEPPRKEGVNDVFGRLLKMIVEQPASRASIEAPEEETLGGQQSGEDGAPRFGADVARADGKGEFFVQDGTVRYVFPNLVFHYIARHRYKLPASVEAAVLRCCDPGDDSDE